MDYELLEYQLEAKEITLVSIARKAKIPVSTLRTRYREKGLSLRDAVELPQKKGGDVRRLSRRREVFWYNGIGGVPSSWGEVLGITESTFLQRLRRYEHSNYDKIFTSGSLPVGGGEKGNEEYRKLSERDRSYNLLKIPEPTETEKSLGFVSMPTVDLASCRGDVSRIGRMT